MKALVQKALKGSVSVDGNIVGKTGPGFVVLIGVRHEDTEKDAEFLATKTAGLRIFPDESGKMNLSLLDTGGSALVVSQFTLHADTAKGNRPGFANAAPPEQAKHLYEKYISELQNIIGPGKVETGIFRAKMIVEIINDGPVTIELKSMSETSH